MAERDKTITITSHLHFASSVNILGICCYAAVIAHNALHASMQQKKKRGSEHDEMVIDLTHERYSGVNL